MLGGSVMKIAAIADIHLGNHKRFGGPVTASLNERCRATLAVLEAACTVAADEACAALVVAGDLFDYDRPEAQLLSEVQRIFKGSGLVVFILVGNHDQTSTAKGDHALGPLEPYARIIEKPRRVTFRSGAAELLLVPFQPGNAKDWLPGALSAIAAPASEAGRATAPPVSRPRLLAIHLGVRDAKTAPWLAASPDAIDVDTLRTICGEHAIEAVVAGNWHDRRQWSFPDPALHIFQLGALVPTGWDNPGLEGYGTLGIWDSERGLSYRELPGPRFVKVRTRTDLEVALERAKEEGHTLYVSEQVLPEMMAEHTAFLESVKDQVAAFEVLPDEAVAKAEARTAAESARSAETLTAALDAFVRDMPLTDGVDRNEVLERSRKYLR